MPITFDRDICRNLDETISREWVITNGLGGYAAGTVSGTLTRMQQGLLVASQANTAIPELLLAKVDEEVFFDQRTYYLGTNEYRDGTLNPAGFVHLETFRLEEGFPIFTYRLGGIERMILEKRIWMPYTQNTTYIQYRVLRTPAHQEGEGTAWRSRYQPRYPDYIRSYNTYGVQSPLTLNLLPFVAQRPYNQPQYGRADWQFQIKTLTGFEGDEAPALPRGVAGCSISANEQTSPYYLLAVGHPESSIQFLPTGVWYWHFQHRHDQLAGLPETDDLYLPGVVRAQLWPEREATLTLIVSTEKLVPQTLQHRQVTRSYEQALDYQRSLTATQQYFGEGGGSVHTLPVLPLDTSGSSAIHNEEFLQLLHQAGNRLLVRRPQPAQERIDGAAFLHKASDALPAITPGYYQLEENIRETLIALPGLMLTTRRHHDAQRLLRSLSRHFRQGLLPNRLPAPGCGPLEDTDYANADVSLWYFYALDKYLRETHDDDLLDELYPHLADCLNWYIQGTLYGIRVDPIDNLLRAEAPGQALTWMNAFAHGAPVTPRSGKPVEVNALWYHALSLMHEWSQLLYQRGRINHAVTQYRARGEHCQRSFNERFWNSNGGYLYDLIDGPEGNDASLRPNQLLAISLRYAVLYADRQPAIADIVGRTLLTPYGLRTLAPRDSRYQRGLPENREELQQALHQGAAWPWLIGPYIDALLHTGGLSASSSLESSHRVSASNDSYKETTWRRGLSILEPFRQHMQRDMLGSISSVYAGEAPHASGPQLASAISIGEILRAYNALAHLGIQSLERVISA